MVKPYLLQAHPTRKRTTSPNHLPKPNNNRNQIPPRRNQTTHNHTKLNPTRRLFPRALTPNRLRLLSKASPLMARSRTFLSTSLKLFLERIRFSTRHRSLRNLASLCGPTPSLDILSANVYLTTPCTALPSLHGNQRVCRKLSCREVGFIISVSRRTKA